MWRKVIKQVARVLHRLQVSCFQLGDVEETQTDFQGLVKERIFGLIFSNSLINKATALMEQKFTLYAKHYTATEKCKDSNPNSASRNLQVLSNICKELEHSLQIIIKQGNIW